ncbi:33 kDa chaperonin [Acrasis kona]|uniref:33 kDa chaperonin n=1 Tax=Acrasis kona TaxID=1008807 RepID=A0AAW2YMF1_9EUKA
MMRRMYSVLTKRRVRDYLVNGMTEDGLYRISIMDNTSVVNNAQNRFKYKFQDEKTTKDALSLYAKTMSCSSILSSFLRGEERVIVGVFGSGPISQICTESVQLGETRGYMYVNPEATRSGTSLLFDEENNPGLFTVEKILYNNSKPITSSIKLTKGDISNELLMYFKESEQVPTASHLGVISDSSSQDQCLFSYGIVVQALPAKDSFVSEVQQLKLKELQTYFDDLTQELKQSCSTRDEMHQKLFSFKNDLKLTDKVSLPPLSLDTIRFKPLDFFCRCSMKGMMDNVSKLGSAEIEDMHAEVSSTKTPITITCDYCNENYHFGVAEFDTLKQNLSE